MTPTLATRLTKLLDTLQRVHDCPRHIAARVVGEACGISHTHVTNLATGAYRSTATESRYDAPLSLLESRYRLQLRALDAFDRACGRWSGERAA